MMKVDFFETIYSIAPKQHSKSVIYYLDRIQNGAVRTLVEKIRKEPNKKIQNDLKKGLSNVAFGGTFTTRNANGIKTASGLCILDFDDVDDVVAQKEILSQNKHCFATWVSPSGKGVKALFRINETTNPVEYTAIFNQLVEDFAFKLDKSGQDICRMCYESYDPEIYVNVDAEIYQPDLLIVPIEVQNLGSITNIPLTDQDEIANRLMIWFKGKFISSQRNASLTKLAFAFNNFGVNKSTAERYLGTYEQKDFNRKEIQSIINSAYKHTADHGTKQFEDKQKIKKIEYIILGGKKDVEILKEFPEVDKDKLTAEIEIIRNNIKIEEFWKYSKKGDVQILPYRFKLYLENLQFFKYYPSDNKKTFFFIKKETNFIDIITEYQLKDEVLRRLIANNKLDVFDILAERTTHFSSNYLSMLDTAKINIHRDSKEFAMLYYRNMAVKVFDESIESIDYGDLTEFVWKNTVINRDFSIDTDHHKSQFRSFVWFISGQNRDKYNTMKSVIGYLLHSHKTSSNNKAVILNDETVSDTPNGGSGKGILINAISNMKRVSVVDGKTFDFNKSFAFQTVNTDTQVLAFDDVRKNFEFERLFSIITEGITIEYKGKDAIKIPVQDSPKILISTNYTIKADGGSFKRRMFEVEMSDYFGAHRTPLDHFGNLLFDEWDKKEWERFDKFMINCIQFYLKNGLVESKTNNLQLRKFINETSQEFYEYAFVEKQVPLNCRVTKPDFTDKFHAEYPDSKKYVTNRILCKWVKKYSDFAALDYLEGNSNGKRWFQLGEQKQENNFEIDNEEKF